METQLTACLFSTSVYYYDFPELEIILFLHACLYSQEYSKSVIDLYWTVRTHCPEIFNGRSPLSPELQKHMNLR